MSGGRSPLLPFQADPQASPASALLLLATAVVPLLVGALLAASLLAVLGEAALDAARL